MVAHHFPATLKLPYACKWGMSLVVATMEICSLHETVKKEKGSGVSRHKEQTTKK